MTSGNHSSPPLIGRWLDALERVKRDRNGWRSRCPLPGHPSKGRRLHIAAGERGVIVFCHGVDGHGKCGRELAELLGLPLWYDEVTQ